MWERAGDKIAKMYRRKLSEKEVIAKEKLWKVLIDTVLRKCIGDQNTLTDIGAAGCEFINNIKC